MFLKTFVVPSLALAAATGPAASTSYAVRRRGGPVTAGRGDDGIYSGGIVVDDNNYSGRGSALTGGDRYLAGTGCPCFDENDLLLYESRDNPSCEWSGADIVISVEDAYNEEIIGLTYVDNDNHWQRCQHGIYFPPGYNPGWYYHLLEKYPDSAADPANGILEISQHDLSAAQVEACQRLIQERCEDVGGNQPVFSYTVDLNGRESRDGSYYLDPNGDALTNGEVGSVTPNEIIAWEREEWLLQDADPGFTTGRVTIQFENPVLVTKAVVHIQEAECMGLDSPDRIQIELPSVGSVAGFPQTISLDDTTSRYRQVTINTPPGTPFVESFDIIVEALRTVDGKSETPTRCESSSSSTNVKFGISEIELYGYNGSYENLLLPLPTPAPTLAPTPAPTPAPTVDPLLLPQSMYEYTLLNREVSGYIESRSGDYYTDPDNAALKNGITNTIAAGEVVAWTMIQKNVCDESQQNTNGNCPDFINGKVKFQFDQPVQLTKVVVHVIEDYCEGLDSPYKIAFTVGGWLNGFPQESHTVTEDGTALSKIEVELPVDAPFENGFTLFVEGRATVDGPVEDRSDSCPTSPTEVKFGISEVELYGRTA